MNQLTREQPIIDYFAEHYSHYGFDSAIYNGIGYDFTLSQDNKVIFAELESQWEHYISHRHHLDDRFKAVSLLILFNKDNPPSNIEGIPPDILHIDHKHFFSIVPKDVIYYLPKSNYKSTSMTIRIPQDIDDRITDLALKSLTTKSAWIIKCLEQKAYKHKNKPLEINPNASGGE